MLRVAAIQITKLILGRSAIAPLDLAVGALGVTLGKIVFITEHVAVTATTGIHATALQMDGMGVIGSATLAIDTSKTTTITVLVLVAMA